MSSRYLSADGTPPCSSDEHVAQAMQLLADAGISQQVADCETDTGRALAASHRAGNQITAAGVHVLNAVLAAFKDADAKLQDELTAQKFAARQGFSAEPHRSAVRVRVFHNTTTDGRLFGYKPDHQVVEVYSYDDPDVVATTRDSAVADRAFHLFNVGHDPEFGIPDHRACDYRARGNRSLSMGDVVGIDNRFYACASSGWSPIDTPAMADIAQPGTTPMS